MPILQKNDVFADRFLLKELVGSRGISELWKAEDLTKDGAVVAIRLFAPQSRLDKPTRDLLHEDFKKIGSLSHPFLLQAHEQDVHDGVPYLVYPFLSRGSLRQRLQQQGPLSEKEVAMLLQQIGSSLFYLHAHEQPTLHQHINPDNILITDDGDFVLSDYGISSGTRRALRKVVGQPTTMTTAYSPPELFAATPIRNAASDIFSFGITVYEACSGEVPWMGSGGLALLQGAEIPQLPFRYSRELQNMIKASLDPDWEKRPTAAELGEEGIYYLEKGHWKTFGRFGTATVRLVQQPEQRSVLKPVLISAAILVVLLTAAYFFLFAPEAFNNKAGSDSTITVISNRTTEQAGLDGDDANLNAETAKANTEIQSRSQQSELASTPSPVATAPQQTKAEPAPEKSKPAAPAEEEPKPRFKKPSTLAGFLQQLPDENVPLSVRERWRTDFQRFFTPDAIVTYTSGGAVVGVFTVNEMVDILLSADTSSTTQIDTLRKNEAGKIEELYVYTSSEN